MNLNSFYYFLKQEGFLSSTIGEDMKNVERFIKWGSENHMDDMQQISYTEVLNYVQYLKIQQVSTPPINIRLNSIRKYYEQLKQEGVIERNPTRSLHIKGALR